MKARIRQPLFSFRPLFFRYVEVYDQVTKETTTWKEIEWSLNGNLKVVADIVITCLNKAYDNAYFELPKDSYTDTLLMSYSFSGNSIADALSTIAEQNETEWWLETTTEYVGGKRKYILHFDKCELGDTIELNDNYTEDANGVWQSGGLKSVSQSGNTNIIPQKLYVYGSERNIIKKTVEQQTEGGAMNVSYDKKLRLPKLFPSGIIGANGAIYENEALDLTITLNEDSSLSIGGINNHFEQVKIFDEVYPKMDMTIIKDGVSVQNPNGENPIYWIKADRLKSITTENPVDGSINPGKLGLLIEGCTLMCTFTSGLLNGREFECSWRESTAEIGLIPIDENDVQIPSGVFKPQEGDTFILWNLAMPQSSIDIAQNELCVEAIKHIEELATSITETDCVSEPEAFLSKGHNQRIKVGQRITVASDVFRNGKLASRIIKFSYKLTKPYDISFTLASSRQTGRLATLENMIADVTHEVHATGQVQRAISRRQWHDTEEMMQMLDSIQKQLVVVGDENNAFVTTCDVNYDNSTKILTVSKGYLQHQSYTENEWKGAWLIKGKDGNDDTSINISAIDEQGTTPFYVYFVCSKNNNSGYVEVGSGLPQFSDYYVFVLGILSSEFEGDRIFNQSSGLTTIAGGTITTDVIQDPARRLVIDYSNGTITARNGGTIRGAIQFEKGEGENDLGTAIEKLKDSVEHIELMAPNILSGAMIVDFEIDRSSGYNNVKFRHDSNEGKYLTTPLKANSDYVFSIESITLKGGSITPANIAIAIFDSSISTTKKVWTIPYADSKLVYKFTTPSNIQPTDVLLIYGGQNGLTIGVGFTAFGVKLAEGSTYTGWEGSPIEQQVLLSLNNAMKGSTDIIGGLVLTNLIQLKNEEGDVSAGISGLETNDVFAWAGGSFENAIRGTIPVILKRQGKGSKLGCLIVEDDDKVRVKTNNGSVLIDADGGLTVYDGQDTSEVEKIRILNENINADYIAFNSILALNKKDNTDVSSYSQATILYESPSFNVSKPKNMLLLNTNGSISCSVSVGGTWKSPNLSGVQTVSDSKELTFELYNVTSKAIIKLQSEYDTNHINVSIGQSGGRSLTLNLNLNKEIKDIPIGTYKFRLRYLDGVIMPVGAVPTHGSVGLQVSSFSTTIEKSFSARYTEKKPLTIIGNNGMIVRSNYDEYVYIEVGGDTVDMRIGGLPTSAPNETGRLYNSGGTLKIS